MYNKHNTFLEIEGNREWMLRTKNWCIVLCVKQIFMFQDEALDSCQKKWMMSPRVVQKRERFGVPNFARELNRVLRYVACIQTCGVLRIGLRFRFPIIWLLAQHYTPAYNVPGNWWKDVLLIEGYKPLRTYMANEYDLTQLHANYNISNLDLLKRRAV